jgi:hypothetical protein
VLYQVLLVLLNFRDNIMCGREMGYYKTIINTNTVFKKLEYLN